VTTREQLQQWLLEWDEEKRFLQSSLSGRKVRRSDSPSLSELLMLQTEKYERGVFEEALNDEHNYAINEIENALVNLKSYTPLPEIPP
jgi:hypothetical protein